MLIQLDFLLDPVGIIVVSKEHSSLSSCFHILPNVLMSIPGLLSGRTSASRK